MSIRYIEIRAPSEERRGDSGARQAARVGRGGAALATAAIGSFVAGTISTIAITFLAPLFTPADYFALIVLAFERSSALVWTLIASLYIGNVMLLILNYPLIRIWVKLLAIPRELLYSGILLFATFGVYSLSNSVVDLMVMYAIGVLGFFMRRYDFPVGPVILGVILGPLMEAQFRRALQVSEGELTTFFTRPLSLAILVLALVALVVPYLPALVKRLRGERPDQGRMIFGGGDED
jgi:putative tricarboxylic transport membrane protein